MPNISNYREKTLLLAHYFCEKSKDKLTPTEVYEMWCNWFSGDFKIDNKPTFKMVNDKLVFREKSKSKDAEKLCKQYNRIFHDSYKWIKKKVENEHNSKQHFKNELDRERRREFARILTIAKPLGLYVSLSQKNLYKNRLGYFQLKQGNKTFTAGDCDKMIEYLEKMKKEKSECNSNN